MNKIFLLLMVLPIFSCARSYMVKTDSTKIEVDQVNVIAVAHHRPTYEPAEHSDFSVKNRELECMHSDTLWNDLLKDEAKIRSCVNSIEASKATYYYVPATQPYLEIDPEEETNPKCLKETLAKIPLPREIYYLGNPTTDSIDEEPLECLSSSFSVKTNQLMMTPTSFLKKKIVLPFPLERELKNARDVSLWLMVTTFTILKNDEQAQGKLWATRVPESVCKKCFKHDARFDDKYSRRIKPVFWP